MKVHAYILVTYNITDCICDGISCDSTRLCDLIIENHITCLIYSAKIFVLVTIHTYITTHSV